VGGILNVLLDPLLIFTFKMGTGGAALATMISQIVSFSILAVQFVFGKSIVQIHLKYVSRKWEDYKQIIATGLPTIYFS